VDPRDRPFEARSLRGEDILLKSPAPKVVLPKSKWLRAIERRMWHM